jgi:hypothetical protein
MIKRFFAPTLLLFIGLTLGSCTSFSEVVTDNWPSWAGGMPKDVPPRPGAPGYDEFLVHQQGKDAPAPGTPAENANAQAAPSGNRSPTDRSVVQGGLY